MTNQNLVPAIFVFDETKKYEMKGLHNPLNRWNGWYMPYIHENSIYKFIEQTNCDEFIASIIDEKLKIVELCEDEYYISWIAPDEINGQNYYNLGYLGLCFDLKN